MKFKHDIEAQAGFKDKDGQLGSTGQILTSTGSQTDWVDQSTINAGNAEHVVIYAKNTSGASISKGTPVYITGTVGATDTVQIAPADAGNSAKMPAVGLLDDTLANNAFGYVITGGFMDNITTDPIDGATPSSNDTVYVKSGGGLTLTKPTGSNLIQNVAKVGKVSGGNSGSLIVSSILRTNDVPNLTTGKIWVGSAANTIESATIYLDETNGRMGIGTTSPDSLLEISTTDATKNFIKLTSGGGGVNPALVFEKSAAEQGVIQYIRNGDLKIYNTDSDGGVMFSGSSATNYDMYINNSGNVGIGTTSPSTKLELKSPSINSIPFQVTNSSDNDAIFSILEDGGGDGRARIFNAAGTLNVNLDSSGNSYLNGGNVGIGTTSPTHLLTLETASSPGLKIKDTTQGTTLLAFSQDSNSHIGTYSSHPLVLDTNSSERMRITSSGNVGIGTTSPDSKLDIEDSNPFITIQGSSSSYVNAGVQFISNHASTVRGLGNFYYSAHSDVEWFSGLPYNDNDAFVINRNASYTVPSSQSSPPGIGASAGTLLKVSSTGAIQFNNYSGTNKTGTPTYLLGTDASGNIVKTNTVPGSGPGPYLPLAGGTMTGDLKLNDAVQLKLGTGNDLRIYHSGTNSNIENNTGTLQIIQNLDDGDISFKSDNGSGGTTEYFRLDGGSTMNVFSKPTWHGDGVKSFYGNSQDLQIFHDGSNSYVSDTGTGSLILTGTDLQLKSAGDEFFMYGAADGQVALYHNGTKKFETGGTGVTVIGSATATTFLGDLNGTINTATTAVTKANATNDTTVATTAFVQNLIGTIPAGLVFQGTWNAATNTPTLTSGSGTTGHFYIVSTDGSTNLDGITDWKVGDWAVFVEQGASDQWEKVDNSSVLDGSGTGQKVTKWNGSGTSNTLTDGPITFSGNTSTFAGSVITPDVFTPNLYITSSGTTATNRIDNDGSQLYLTYGGTSNRALEILNSNGNATFAGRVTSGAHTINSAVDGILTLNQTSTDTGWSYINFNTSGARQWYVGMDNNKNFDIYNDNTDSLGLTINYINNQANFAGNVNLPDSKKILLGTGNDFQLYHDGTHGVLNNTVGNLYTSALGSMMFRTSLNVTALTLDASQNAIFYGNVGIGTTSPSQKLHVNSGSTNEVARFESTDATAYLSIMDNNTSNSLQGIGSSGNNLTFYSNNAERIRIDSSGRLLINATSTAFNDKLYVNGEAYSTSGWRVGTSSTYVGKIRNNAGKLEIVTDTNRDIQFGDVVTPNIMYIDCLLYTSPSPRDS